MEDRIDSVQTQIVRAEQAKSRLQALKAEVTEPKMSAALDKRIERLTVHIEALYARLTRLEEYLERLLLIEFVN